MAKQIAMLRWDWRPAGPLVTGYSQNLAQATGRISRGAREVVNLRTRTPEHVLTPSFLVTSVKGVFRSAAEWLVERTAAELGVEHFVTCGYGLAVPEGRRPKLGIVQRGGLCPVCRVFGGTGCLSGRDVAPAQRQVGRVRFSFNQANDATYGKTTNSPHYKFTWEQVEHRGKPLLIEQLQFEPDTVLEARLDDADDFALALLWLAGDLISSGFFRFGRFTSRGYGVVRLQPRAYLQNNLAALLSDSDVSPQHVEIAGSGLMVATNLLNKHPISIIRSQVENWMD